MQYKIEKAGYLILVTLAWIYIWLRAFHIPFQSDEAATFFMYVQPGQFFPPAATIDANNHILNSILTWISYHTFGSSPVSLRLPNVLSALVYFFFIFKLSNLLNFKFLKWGFILFSLGTNFILEFFSYSRGYGLSIAFLTAALYELIILIKEVSLKRIILSVIFIILATAANLNLIFISLTVYLILAIILLFRYKSEEKKNAINGLLIVLLAGGISSIYFIHYSFQIRDVAGFYYGSSAGFLKVTVDSLAAMVSGRFKAITVITAVVIFIFLFCMPLIQLVTNKKNNDLFRWQNVFIFFLLVSLIGSLLLNKIWHVNFQEDRAAMHLIPVFYGMIFFSIDSYSPIFRRYSSILILPLAFILIFSVQQFSLTKSVYGKSQQAPVEFFRFIKEEASGKPFPPVVSSYQARRQGWAFMNYRSGGLLNPLAVSNFPDKDADFLIHELPLADSLKSHFEMVVSDQNTQTGLFRNIDVPPFFSFKTLGLETGIRSENEYLEMFKISSDSLIGKGIRLETELMVESPKKPLQAALVVEVFDKDRKSLVYDAIDLDQLQPQWDQAHQQFRHVLLIPEMPPESESILMYLWNKKKVQVNIPEGSLTIKSVGTREK